MSRKRNSRRSTTDRTAPPQDRDALPTDGPGPGSAPPFQCGNVLTRDHVLLVGGFLLLAVGLVFGQTLRHEFVFDDRPYVSENPRVSAGLTPGGIAWVFTHRHGGNWHPLTGLSHLLDCQLFGLRAGWHHLVNIVLHAATVVLLFLVLRQMTGRFWPSALVAALFAIHPLRVESVAWVAERKDVLSGLFFMLTLGAYVRYAQRPFSWRRYLLLVVLFALGLMAKPMLVTLPLVLLLLDYWPLGRFADDHQFHRTPPHVRWTSFRFPGAWLSRSSRSCRSRCFPVWRPPGYSAKP